MHDLSIFYFFVQNLFFYCWEKFDYLGSIVYLFFSYLILYLPVTWHAVVTGILSEIPEMQCVEINGELLRTIGHMYNFCLREFVFTFFNSRNLSNPPGTKGTIPTSLLWIERGVADLSVALIKDSYSSFLLLGYFPVKLRLALITSMLGHCKSTK